MPDRTETCGHFKTYTKTHLTDFIWSQCVKLK